MRFNQVIRAEPRAGECGPSVPEYQTGLGAGLRKWKSHLQLSWGPGELGPGREPLPAPPQNHSAVTSACRSRAPHKGWELDPQLGGDREAGLGVCMEAPWRPALLSTTSACTSLGCPPQHRHPGVQIEDLVLSPSTPLLPTSCLPGSQPSTKAGVGGTGLRIPVGSKPPTYGRTHSPGSLCPLLSPWTPATISCSGNHRPLHRLCPLPGAPSLCPPRPAVCHCLGQSEWTSQRTGSWSSRPGCESWIILETTPPCPPVCFVFFHTTYPNHMD